MATKPVLSSEIGDIYTDEFGNEFEKWAVGWRDKKSGRVVNRAQQAKLEDQVIQTKAQTNPFKVIRNAQSLDKSAGYNSYSWLQSQVKRLGSLGRNPSQLMAANVQFTSRISMGSMYLFNYDAKHKDTLPWWDMFPLTIPFSPAKGGFLGLNIHYLPYYYRIALLEKLFDFATSETLTADTKVLFSWGMLQESTKFRAVSVCVKHYLLDHVASNFMFVDPRDWYTAAMLPVDRFVGSGKGAVWKHSLNRMGR